MPDFPLIDSVHVVCGLFQELQYEFRMDDTPIYKDTIAGWLGIGYKFSLSLSLLATTFVNC